MTFIGNIFLLIATYIYFTLVSALFGKEPPRGDQAVGHAWGIIYMNIAFLVCMCIITLVIGYKGGFLWISPSKLTQLFLITVGLLATIITTALSSLFKYENDRVPALLKFFSGFVPIVIPLVLVLTAVILLNNNFRNAVPVAMYKWPLLAIYITGITGIISATVGFLKQNHHNKTVRIEEAIRRQEANHVRMLAEIDSCDVTKNMVFILVLTDANHDKEVKEKAVAKVKTNPCWQQELIERLQNGWAPQAFTFLASNDADEPSLFTEAVKAGVLIQAELIREGIRRCTHASHFYEGLFLWEIERVLRTVDKFNGMGTDYRPAVKQLRAALDESSRFDKQMLSCIPLLDEWLKKHC